MCIRDRDWPAAAADYLWILERQPDDASALYNLGNVRGSEGDWHGARDLYGKASLARPGFAMARSSEALAAWQEGDLAWAEVELRKLIRRYPLFADARAALSGLLWRQGSAGEAESNWAAAAGLDQRYRQADSRAQYAALTPEPELCKQPRLSPPSPRTLNEHSMPSRRTRPKRSSPSTTLMTRAFWKRLPPSRPNSTRCRNRRPAFWRRSQSTRTSAQAALENLLRLRRLRLHARAPRRENNAALSCWKRKNWQINSLNLISSAWPTR